MLFYFNNFRRPANLISAVNRMRYGGHSPNLAEAFAAVRSDIFTASNGARQNDSVLRLAVVFVTETPSSYWSTTLYESRKLANMDIGVVTVAVGTFVDRQLLSSITSYPSSSNMFVVPSVRNVTNLADPIKRIICSGTFRCVVFVVVTIFITLPHAKLCEMQYCIFHRCSLVPHFPVVHFPLSHCQRPPSVR